MTYYKNTRDAKVLFMGTPALAAAVLKAIIAAGYSVVGVVCQEDKEVGRKKTILPPPSKIVALQHGIPVFQPHKIRLDYEWATALAPDVIVTMAYGQIIPQGLLDIPSHGCLNLHGSLLPKLRGAAPIQRAIMEGDSKTGITLMQMVAAMDAGVMYKKEEVLIDPSDDCSSLSMKMAEAASRLILDCLLDYLNGRLVGTAQDEAQVTLAPKIKPDDEHLPLSLPLVALVNYVRGLSEEPGAYLTIDGKKLKIYKIHVYSSETGAPLGSIVNDRRELIVQGSDGLFAIDDLQLEGKVRLEAKSFLNGAHGLLGKVLA